MRPSRCGEGRLDLGVAERRPGSRGSSGRRGSAARLFSASPPCFFRCRATSASTAARCVGVEVAAVDEVVGQRAGTLSRGPGLEGGDELALVDQAVLQGEQPEEQVAVGGGAAMVRSSRSLGQRRSAAIIIAGILAPQRRQHPHIRQIPPILRRDAVLTSGIMSYQRRFAQRSGDF